MARVHRKDRGQQKAKRLYSAIFEVRKRGRPWKKWIIDVETDLKVL